MKSLCINQDFRRLAAILRLVDQREPDIVCPGKISLVIEKPPTQRTVDPTFMLLVKLLAIFLSPQKFSHSYNKELVAQNLLMNSLDKHHPKDKSQSKGPFE